MNNNLVYIITGTSRGIGKSLALYYLSLGNFVFGCSTSNATIKDDRYDHFVGDMSDPEVVMNFVKSIRGKTSRVDVLINNAAINPAILYGALLPTSLIVKTYNVNVLAPIILCRESIKLMARNKFGRIINLGSMATMHNVPGESLYTSTKSALYSYTKVLSKEIYSLGITANVIAPSVIKTDLSDKIDQAALENVLKRNAIHEFGVTGDVTNAIDFLIKRESNSITGQVIYLGGV